MAALEAAQKQWQEIQKRILTIPAPKLTAELSTAVENRQKLEAQLQENISVDKEFSTLPDDAKVFKAHGPVLLPQDLFEAKELVSKRLEFIRGEIERVEGTLRELQVKGQRVQGEIMTLSNEPVRKQT